MWQQALGAALALGAVSTALAQAPSPPARALRLDAPEAVRPLLTRYAKALQEAETLPEDEADRVALIRRVRRQLSDLLATEGYFSPDYRFAREAGQPVVLTVDPGPRTTIQNVDLTLQGAVAHLSDEADRRAALQQDWRLPAGQPFRQADWDAAKAALVEALAEHRYPAARLVESRAEIDPDAASARLSVVVDSGPAVTLGTVDVTGLENYAPELVRRLNPLQAGEAYDRSRLLAYQSALQSTPYFAAATVTADLDALAPDGPPVQTLPVKVAVSEAKPRRIQLGLGYSSNNGARGEIAYRNSDWLGRAWDLSSGVRLEQRHQLLFADAFLPPGSLPGALGFGAQLERSDVEDLRLTRQGIGAIHTRPRDDGEAAVRLTLQREERAPRGGASSHSTNLTVNLSRTWRTVDDRINPRRGSVLTIEVGGASRLALSDQNFLRGYGRGVHYWPMGERDVLILRAEGGATLAKSRQGIPEDFLFRAGGAQSVRGYAYQSLGVREGRAVVGGRYLATLSAEYVHWLTPDWGLAGFADAGNASDDRPNFRLLPGYGVGARWKSPAGPLALDLGYGQAERRLRLHFAIAIAF